MARVHASQSFTTGSDQRIQNAAMNGIAGNDPAANPAEWKDGTLPSIAFGNESHLCRLEHSYWKRTRTSILDFNWKYILHYIHRRRATDSPSNVTRTLLFPQQQLLLITTESKGFLHGSPKQRCGVWREQGCQTHRASAVWTTVDGKIEISLYSGSCTYVERLIYTNGFGIAIGCIYIRQLRSRSK
jgi:hypothetical protein